MKISYKKIITTLMISGFFINPVVTLALDPITNVQANTALPGYYNYNATTTYNPQGLPGYLQMQQTGTNPLYNNPAQTPQVNPYQAANNPFLTPTYIDSRIQSGMSTASTTSTASTSSGVLGRTSTSLAGCGAGQIMSNMITGSISKAMGKTAEKTAKEVVSTVAYVPVTEKGIVADNIQTLTNNSDQTTSARVGTLAPGAIGALGLQSPSWDAVAYCIVNAMIIYVADSTIEWINTGFNGNPAFLNDPDQFFKQLADEEAAAFVQNLAYGVTGKNVCDVFRAAMVQSILNQYNQQNGYGYGYDTGGYNRGLSNGFLGCSFDQNPDQYNQFVNGNFIQGGGWNSWYQMTQNPSANPYDTYYRTNDNLASRVNTVQASQERELGWNGGFLSYKKCDPKDPKKCTTITPGGVIQSQLNETLSLGKNRLVLADKFDQVVTALVNQLITTALGTATQSMGGGY